MSYCHASYPGSESRQVNCLQPALVWTLSPACSLAAPSLGSLLVERQGSQQGSYISGFSHSCSILAKLYKAFSGSSLVGALMHKRQSLEVFSTLAFDQVTSSIAKTFTYIVFNKRFCCYIENDIHKMLKTSLTFLWQKGRRKRNSISSLNPAFILSTMTQ